MSVVGNLIEDLDNQNEQLRRERQELLEIIRGLMEGDVFDWDTDELLQKYEYEYCPECRTHSPDHCRMSCGKREEDGSDL